MIKIFQSIAIAFAILIVILLEVNRYNDAVTSPKTALIKRAVSNLEHYTGRKNIARTNASCRIESTPDAPVREVDLAQCEYTDAAGQKQYLLCTASRRLEQVGSITCIPMASLPSKP